MAEIHSIEALHASGHSNREIARLLGIDRGTVNRYVARLAELRQAKAAQNQPQAPPGVGAGNAGDASVGPGPHLERIGQVQPPTEEGQNRPNAPTGNEHLAWSVVESRRSGSASQCEPYREQM